MDYISEYEIKFKVVNEHLFGALVGDGGKHQRQFEKEMGVKLVISKESKMVQLSGESVAHVKDAEKKVVNIISNHSFKAEVGNSFAGQILGHRGEKIANIRKETNVRHANLLRDPNLVPLNAKFSLISYPIFFSNLAWRFV